MRNGLWLDQVVRPVGGIFFATRRGLRRIGRLPKRRRGATSFPHNETRPKGRGRLT